MPDNKQRTIYLDNSKWLELSKRIDEPDIYNMFDLFKNLSRTDLLKFPISKSNYYFLFKLKDYQLKKEISNVIMNLSLFYSFKSNKFLFNELIDSILLNNKENLQYNSNNNLNDKLFTYSYMQKIDNSDKKIDFYSKSIRKNSKFIIKDKEMILYPTNKAVSLMYSYERDLLTSSSNKTKDLDFIDILLYKSFR